MSTSSKPTLLRFCRKHAEEPIIRVSTDPEDKQTLYCHECLDNCSSDSKSKLVKLTQLSQSIYDQITEKLSLAASKNLEGNLEDLSIDRAQAFTQIDEMITKQKQKVDDNLKKIENCVLETLKSAGAEIHKRYDDLKLKLEAKLDEYHANFAFFSDNKAVEGCVVTKEEIDKELASNEDTKGLLEKVRARLDVIKRLDQLNAGTAIEELKKDKLQLEPFLQNFNIIPSVDEKYYQTRVKLIGLLYTYLIFSGIESEGNEELLTKIKRPVNLI